MHIAGRLFLCNSLGYETQRWARCCIYSLLCHSCAMGSLRKSLAFRTTVLEVKYVRTGSRTKSALLTPAERADDLLKGLTREEKVG
jgi:hypothetical protein